VTALFRALFRDCSRGEIADLAARDYIRPRRRRTSSPQIEESRSVGCLLRIFPGFDCFCDSLFDVVQLIGERFLFFFRHAVVRRYVLNDLQCGANAREIAHCHVFGFGHCLTSLGKFFPTARAAADRAAWIKQGRQDGNRRTNSGQSVLYTSLSKAPQLWRSGL
jgi:hypothetical protein